jgi:hypothetical protein
MSIGHPLPLAIEFLFNVVCIKTRRNFAVDLKYLDVVLVRFSSSQ